MSSVDRAATTAGAQQPAPKGPEPGARIGRYTVLGRLGAGGMGVVLDAFDPELDRRVAIKLMHPGREGTGRIRLLREAQAMARLSHPNVVQVYDVGVTGEQIFIAMERVVGSTATDWLAAAPRSWREIVACYVDAARGLAAAHDVGLVHRDFKPDNVLVGDDPLGARALGRVRVADFGVASLGGPAGASLRSTAVQHDSDRVIGLTTTGAAVGTPRYMAPEQHSGLDVDGAADQFALCVALHEALFGELPYPGDTREELCFAVCSGRYREPARTTEVPAWLVAVIRRGLAVEPGDRHRDIPALIVALQADPDVARTRRLRVTAALAGVVAIASASAWFAGAELAEPSCVGGQARIEAIWRPETRAHIDELVHPGAGESWADTAAALVTGLDAYSGAWIEAHDGTCRAHRAGELSNDALDRSMRCLAQRLVAVERVVELVGAADAPGLVGVTEAVVGLPAVDACTDHEALAQEITPPDAAMADAVADVRRRLTRAEVVHDAGSVQTALAEIEGAVADVERIDYAPLRAEASLVTGRLAMDRQDWVTAREDLSRATKAGLASGMACVATEAIVRRMFVDSVEVTELTEALRDREIAEGLLQRCGNAPQLAALLANNVGVIHARTGDRDLAVVELRRALATVEGTSIHPVDHAGMMVNLALLTEEPEAREELLASAVARVTTALGERHLKVLEFTTRLAEQTVDTELARQRLAPVCPVLEQKPLARADLQCHLCWSELAVLDDALGNVDDALASLERASACLPEAEDAEYIRAFGERARGHAALLAGRTEESMAALGRARALLEPHAHLPWIAGDLGHVALFEGRAFAAAGRQDDAVARAHEAETLFAARAAELPDQRMRRGRAGARDLLKRVQGQR